VFVYLLSLSKYDGRIAINIIKGIHSMAISTIRWINHSVKIIDQRKLPTKLEYISCKDVKTLWKAIRNLSVRGAPAIGVAAAYGVILGLKNFKGKEKRKFMKSFHQTCRYIGSSRPTAVNLFNALDRMKRVVQEHSDQSIDQLKRLLKMEADCIYEEDRTVNRRMGEFGSKLIKSRQGIMTVCNAGALATVDYGTAIGVMYTAIRDVNHG